MATSLTGIVGLKAVRITTSSTAQLPFRLTSATFEVTKQQGWWAKSIYLYGRIEGQSSYRKLLRLQYGGRKVASSGAYTTGNYPNQAWIYSQSDVSNLAKTEVPSDVNPVVNLENIDSLYVEMTIDAADAGIKQAFFNDYASTKLFSMARVFQSDDPVYVKRMYITKGGITKQNDRTDIYARLRCGEVERHRWEDGGSLKRVNQTINNKVVSVVQEGDYAVKTKTDSSPELSSGYTINDAAGIADFEYEVTGRCGYTTGDARLTQ
ncbi:hypothetical protein DK058_25415 [Salmonella enterica subsp. enterica serovar Typhi]|nr:hypothetical protein [Salmonella enterica subsp. enterica serovar Typhi]